MLPPICRAAPSLPELPPHKWVRIVLKKNSRRQGKGQPLTQVYRIDNAIGAHSLGVGPFINRHNDQTRHWQKPQQPRMCSTEGRGLFYAHMEQRSHSTAYHTGDRCHHYPFQQCQHIAADMFDPPHPCFSLFFHTATPHIPNYI